MNPRWEKTLLFLVMILFLAVGIARWFHSREESDRELLIESREETTSRAKGSARASLPDNDTRPESEPSRAVIYITGEVIHPGLYTLLPSQRIGDAVEAAGGFTDDADVTAVNLAMYLQDEMKIVIPRSRDNDHTAVSQDAVTVPGAPPASHSGDGSAPSTGKINLNKANAKELEALPYIGAQKAQAIIRYRNEHAFQSVDELKNVKGIGEKMLERIRDLVTVD
ncbi:MAG: ComEA family DNA-binding protein [Peptoniphilaceae bacterium]|nr:ComEA family DNA-binding protein [Peptoniphilaceae bacterium]MDD7433890.1 ComEA family DNA-binding protein [Peptoniphilaceae bacterium]MDY3075199.1 ComEA family DNA-binding protein [Peptoniphilaceae bacterium]